MRGNDCKDKMEHDKTKLHKHKHVPIIHDIMLKPYFLQNITSNIYHLLSVSSVELRK